MAFTRRLGGGFLYILPVLLIAAATAEEVRAFPTLATDEERTTTPENGSQILGLETLVGLATAPVSNDRSACSPAYSCYDSCSAATVDQDTTAAAALSNGSRLVLGKLTLENICFCDSRCKMFADCCYDFEKYCSQNTTESYNHVHFANDRFQYSGQNYPEEDGTLHVHGEDEEVFECINVDQYPSSSFWAKTLCQGDWKDTYVEGLCLEPNAGDTLAQLPVIDSYRIVYRNAFCAECNHVWDYKFMLLDSVCSLFIPSTIINKRQLFSAFLERNCVTYIRSGFSEPPRSCLKTVDTCSKSFYGTRAMQKVARECGMPIQYPVLAYGDLKEPIIYKNPECALCNGLLPKKQRCFKFSPDAAVDTSPVGLGGRTVVEHDDIYGKLYMDPSADADQKDELHHVITNYNSDVTRTVVVNEKDRYIVPIIHECPYGAVFDPFQGQCRQIHCEVGYVLQDNECVLDVDLQGLVSGLDDFISEVADGRNGTPNDHKFTLVITLNVSLDGNPVLAFLSNHSVLERFVGFLNATEFDFGNRLEENSTYAFLPTHRPRWMNNTEIDASYNSSGNGEVLIVLTYSPSFPSFDLSAGTLGLTEFLQNLDNENSVVVAAEYEVYVDDKEVDTKGLNLKAVVDVLTTRLRKLWYVLRSCDDSFHFYHSSELTVANGSDPRCPNISVHGQEEWHGCNETLFFSYDPGEEIHRQDGFFVLLCGGGEGLPSDCPRIRYNVSEYALLPNDTVVIGNGPSYDRGEYEIEDGYVVVCSNFTSQINEIYVFFFGFTVGQIYMTFVLGGISDICLIFTIVTYVIFRDLRTLPGLNLLGLMVANICCNCSLLLGVTNDIASNVCVAGAILIHYFTLANLCWMTSIAFDAYLTFGGNRRRIFAHFKSTYPRRKRYMLYSAFAWGLPGALAGLGVIFNFCAGAPFPMWYGRYISCWINDPYGFIYLFTIPASLVLLSNYVLFVLAISGIKSSKISGSAHRYNSGNPRKDMAVYVKLLTTTGFGWAFGYIAAVSEIPVLWSFFLILVSLQGVFIYLAFFCNRRVLSLYVGLLNGRGRRNGRLVTRGSSSTAVETPRASTSNWRPSSVSEGVNFDARGESNPGLDGEAGGGLEAGGVDGGGKGPIVGDGFDDDKHGGGLELGGVKCGRGRNAEDVHGDQNTNGKHLGDIEEVFL